MGRYESEGDDFDWKTHLWFLTDCISSRFDNDTSSGWQLNREELVQMLERLTGKQLDLEEVAPMDMMNHFTGDKKVAPGTLNLNDQDDFWMAIKGNDVWI